MCDPRPAWRGRARITRSIASDACRSGHVRVNGVRVRLSHAVRVGDEARLRYEGHERFATVDETRAVRALNPSHASRPT
ncbi:S4 domain-containing protein [Nonomuraea sp. NPDC050022]|uniref:S4 domain-containing protein n=1 Tax=Nonomuraea sp. NPDC050022 TaxID=3364358 RepID=UPI0037A5946E